MGTNLPALLGFHGSLRVPHFSDMTDFRN